MKLQPSEMLTFRSRLRAAIPALSDVSYTWHLVALAAITLITGGFGLLAGRVSGHEALVFGTEADRIYINDGFYDPENSVQVGTYRWTQPVAYLKLPGWGPGNVHVKITGVGAGESANEALLSIAGIPVNHITIMPGEQWVIEAWGVTASANPTVTLEGPRMQAPADTRSLGRLVTGLELYSPDARLRAFAGLALIALTALLLYVCLLSWYINPALALAFATSIPALFGPLVAFLDKWLSTVEWVAPVTLSLLLALTIVAPRSGRARINSRWATVLTCIAVTAALLLLTQGFLNAFDSDRMYQVAVGLAEYGLPTRYPGHETWTKYGFGESLISMPFYFLGKLAGLTGGNPDQVQRFAVSMTNIPVTVFTCLLLYRGSRRFAAANVALMVAATYLLSTMALNYARTYFSEPGGAALLLLATLLILPAGGMTAPTRKQLIGAGACLGAMILFKPAFLCYWPVAVLAVIWLAAKESKGNVPMSSAVRARYIITSAACFCAGLLVAGIVQLGYNYLRYHNLPNGLFRTGYEKEPGFSTPLQEGLFGLLLSPGKSLFLYAPVVLLAPVGLWVMYRLQSRAGKITALFILGQTVMGLAFNARWWAWTGNFAWGPRLILPILPLLVLPLAALGSFAREPWAGIYPRTRWRTGLIGVWLFLAILGATISISGAMVDFQVYFRQHGLMLAGDPGEDVTIYDPAQSPIVQEAGYLRDGLTAAIHRPSLADLGLAEEWDVGVPAALVVTACLTSWAAARRKHDPA